MSILDKWPSTPVKHVTGWALVVGTAVFTFAALWSNKYVSEVIYGTWLAFVAAYDGITAYQFKVKRESAWAPPSTASEVTKPEGSGQPVAPVAPPSAMDQGEK